MMEYHYSGCKGQARCRCYRRVEWNTLSDEGISSSLAPYRQAPHVMRGFRERDRAKPSERRSCLGLALSFMQLGNNIKVL